MPLTDHPLGDYRFLPGIAPYSCGVVSAPGFEVVHVTLHRPVAYRRGFDEVERHLASEGRPRAALCGIELRSPCPFNFGVFAEFNAGYARILEGWGLFVEGVNPVARTNVAPEADPPGEPVLYGFSYSRPCDPSLPPTFVVAGAGELPEGVLTTEAIAMLFGRLTKSADWLNKIAGVPVEEAQRLEAAVSQQLTRSMLIFVRWGLVMTFFERDMYNNPDQDLNTLWWDYVERFQLITRPEDRQLPDWAAKIHLGCAPVYYQNYILGELNASQFLKAMERDLNIASIVGDERVGQWLHEKVFLPGARDPWNTMIEKATGGPLSAKFFVEQFVQA